MQDWLPFFSTLIWQSILVIALWMFKSELSALFRRIARFKHGGTEVEFQRPSAEPLEPAAITTEVLALRDERGFFRKEGVTDLVSNSPYLEIDEKVLDSLLVFISSGQRTWIVSTKEQIFFILDDERTRATQRLIQRRIRLCDAKPVVTEYHSESSGSFRLGQSDWWFYSVDLLGDTGPARRRIQSFLRTTEGS